MLPRADADGLSSEQCTRTASPLQWSANVINFAENMREGGRGQGKCDKSFIISWYAFHFSSSLSFSLALEDGGVDIGTICEVLNET